MQAEEKMRVVYDRKCHKLKRLDERGAEANKVDSTRNIIRSLSTKIRIAIQVVDKISVTINKIRDEELWPLLNELIEGYYLCLFNSLHFPISFCTLYLHFSLVLTYMSILLLADITLSYFWPCHLIVFI